MIVDIHTHLGIDRVFDDVKTEEDILSTMERNHIDISIVQPNFGTVEIESIREIHDRIYRMTQKYPGKIYGMATVNPHLSEEAVREELRRCVRKLGFVGIKLHPMAQACPPNSTDGILIAQMAEELKVPLMIHTGSGIPFSLPANIIPVARQFPDVKFVMAHSGMILMSGEALIAARLCPNIYLGVSWSVPGTIAGFIREIGSDRVMFESDEYLNASAEIEKIKYLDLMQKDYDNVMGDTAVRVYRLKENREGGL